MHLVPCFPPDDASCLEFERIAIRALERYVASHAAPSQLDALGLRPPGMHRVLQRLTASSGRSKADAACEAQARRR